MEMLYNVYAWNYASGTNDMVAEGVDKSTANDLVEEYMNRGMDWDAFAIKQDEDFSVTTAVKQEEL